MPTRSQSRSTRSSWWEEKTAGAPAAQRSRRTSRHHVDGDRVEPGERLVEHEHVGVVHQRRGELHALLVAEAEPLHLVGEAGGHPEAVRPPLGGPARGGRGEAVQLGEVAQLLADGHPRVQAALLGHVADPAAPPGVDGAAVEPDLAGVGGQDPQDDAHRRGLARAVGPDEAEELAGPDGEGHVRQGAHVAVALGHTVDLQHARPTDLVPGTSPSPTPRDGVHRSPGHPIVTRPPLNGCSADAADRSSMTR